jgi:hypothetical protein
MEWNYQPRTYCRKNNYMIEHNTQRKYFRNLFLAIFFGILVILIISSYVQAEVTNKLYSKEINGGVLCPNKTSNLRYFKVIKYEKYRNSAVMLCMYEDRKLNVETVLSYTDKWEVIRTNKLFTKGGWYWPIYL